MTPRSLGLALVLAVMLGWFPGMLRGQGMDVPVDVQVPLLYKILTFDRNLEARVGEAVTVAIIYQRGYRASVLTRDQLDDTLSRAGTAVFGKPVRWISVELEETADLLDLLKRNGVDVIYVTPLRGVSLQRIIRASRDGRMITFTGVALYVERGLAVGIGIDRERPQIVVNLAASREEGSDFTAQLLRVCRVIGDAR